MLEVPSGRTFETTIDQAINRPTSEDDTHPSPADRFRLVSRVICESQPAPSGEKWYNAVVRWIRKNFIRDLAVGHDRDSIGPAAYEWFRTGGLLLPNFRPPVTEAWLAWASVQNQHRTDLALN